MAWYLIELQYVPREVARVRPEHRRYMAELVAQGLVAFAGRYPDESAGLFLYRADDERALQPLMDNDPYYTEGAVWARTVREFSPVVATGIGGWPSSSKGENAMARLEGKVAFVTGAARGQGRSHAIRLAEEGADIIAVDIASQIDSAPYPLATPDDLARTVKEVEALDRRIVARQADVRDYDALKAALDDGVARLGRLDIVAANAGIVSFGMAEELTELAWRDMIDVNLTGMWHTAKAAIPHLRAAGGGSIVMTSAVAGLKGTRNLAHYAAAKHGVVGLMQTLANELAADMIRVNTVAPSSVDNDMIHNEATYRLFLPDHQGDITRQEVAGQGVAA